MKDNNVELSTEHVTDRDGNPWPAATTIDGYFVEPGMWVWDYNLRASKVTDRSPHMSHGVPWFETTGGLFDGQRMWRFHPSHGHLAPAWHTWSTEDLIKQRALSAAEGETDEVEVIDDFIRERS
jgi:hypothetical protein